MERDETGRPVRFVGVIRDITEDVRARERVRGKRGRYRTLFDSMDEGFCIIEFFDGPHGPLSDYVHVEANPAYALHAGIPNVVGQKVREMVPDEADGWVDRYGGVLRTGEPIRFERELVATGRHLELAAFRIEPREPQAGRGAVPGHHRRANGRSTSLIAAERAAGGASVAEELAERKILADIVNGTRSLCAGRRPGGPLAGDQHAAAAREFERIFGVHARRSATPCSKSLTITRINRPRSTGVGARRLAGEAIRGHRRVRRSRARSALLRDALQYCCATPRGGKIGAYQFVYDVTDRLEEQARLRQAEEALRQAQKMEAVGPAHRRPRA